MSNRYGAINRDYQSYSGPGDRDLPQSEVSGYQPANRIGEIVVNCYVRTNAQSHCKCSNLCSETHTSFAGWQVDPYEWTRLPPSISGEELNPDITPPGEEGGNGELLKNVYETKVPLPSRPALPPRAFTPSSFTSATHRAALRRSRTFTSGPPSSLA